MTISADSLAECDIIMKGGITSGVVYPKAILRMSRQYRFCSIGGTSAGAIAAVITAAAEHNRSGGGFAVIDALPDEVQRKLLTFFQPSPQFRGVFDFALMWLAGRRSAAIGKLAGAHWLPLLLGFVGNCALFAVTASLAGYFAAMLLFVLAAVIGLAFWLYSVTVTTLRALDSSDFGFCPGRTQPGATDPALSDWMADKIELAAGRMQQGGARPASPLCFKDIWNEFSGAGDKPKRAIDLRMMTTNLSLRRPHALPDMDHNHYFKEDEFRRLFPDWIVDYMIAVSKEYREENKTRPDDLRAQGYYRFPVGGDMPLVVAARMSLSFPILFTAIPLYRRDYTSRSDTETPNMQRMLFSDGGLSSNFPIHFFDALLPRRPTFGVSLEAFDEDAPNRRVRLPMKALSGIWLDYENIEGLVGFLFSLVSAAKDWQDRLQSTLPGYRERIASIYLKNDEGGLNLDMDPAKIANLVEFGDRAGALMTGTSLSPDDKQTFDFEDHKWRRFLVAFARLEETLQQTASSWYDSGQPMKEFVETYMADPRSYRTSTPEWRRSVFERFDSVMAVAQKWNGTALRDANPDNIPKPRTAMRITPVS